MIKELSTQEINMVAGAGTGKVLGGTGLALSIPTIVSGAIAGVPTSGLGFAVMALGIVGTVLSGIMMKKG